MVITKTKEEFTTSSIQEYYINSMKPSLWSTDEMIKGFIMFCGAIPALSVRPLPIKWAHLYEINVNSCPAAVFGDGSQTPFHRSPYKFSVRLEFTEYCTGECAGRIHHASSIACSLFTVTLYSCTYSALCWMFSPRSCCVAYPPLDWHSAGRGEGPAGAGLEIDT